MLIKKRFMLKQMHLKIEEVVHQMDCVVHAALRFLLGTGDSSGGGISGGAVLGTQEECLTFSKNFCRLNYVK